MYQIVHGTAGLLIGSQTGNPWVAFILAVISHFILDAIPHDSIEIKHWVDKGNFIKRISLITLIDLLLFLGLLIILWLKGNLTFNYSIVAGIIGAILPDYIWGMAELFKINNKWLEKYKQLHNGDHALLHRDIYIPLKYSLPVQLISAIIFILLFLKL